MISFGWLPTAMNYDAGDNLGKAETGIKRYGMHKLMSKVYRGVNILVLIKAVTEGRDWSFSFCNCGEI
jgi:hypothetical protein